MASSPRVRILGWVLICGGVLVTALALLIAAEAPAVNPWPTAVAGFALTAIGFGVVVSHEGPRRRDR